MYEYLMNPSGTMDKTDSLDELLLLYCFFFSFVSDIRYIYIYLNIDIAIS